MREYMRRVRIELVHIDDGALVEDAEVDGLAGEVVEQAHARFGFADQLQLGQGAGAQFEQLDAEAVAVLGVLDHIAQRLERLQEAVDGALRQVQLLRQLRDAAVVLALAEGFEHRQGAPDGADHVIAELLILFHGTAGRLVAGTLFHSD